MAWGNRSHGVNDLVAQLNQNCTADTMCVMRSRVFGDNEAVLFSNALSKNSSLKTLLLNGHKISPLASTAIGTSLGQNEALEHIALGDNTFGDDGLSALIDGGLKRNKTLTSIDLEYRSLGPPSAQKIGEVLSLGIIPLQQLLLSRNRLFDDASLIGDFFKGVRVHQRLVSLDLSSNSSPDDWAGDAVSSQLSLLAGQSTLRELLLKENKFGPSAGTSLAMLIGGGLPSLTHLDLAQCALTDGGVSLFAASLMRAPTLTKLDISSNELSAQSAGAISLALGSPECHLSSLVIGSNHLGDEGVSALTAPMTPQGGHLTKLDVSRNGITGEGAAVLIRACGTESACGNVSELILLGNTLEDSGVGLVSGELLNQEASKDETLSKLQILDLTGVNLTSECLGSLLAAVEGSSIKSLVIGGNKVGSVWKDIESFSKRTGIDVAFDREQNKDNEDKESHGGNNEAANQIEDKNPTPQWVEHQPKQTQTVTMDTSHLSLGDSVTIQRLSSATKYNGMKGIISSGLLNGRISIWLEAEHKSIAVRPENLDAICED